MKKELCNESNRCTIVTDYLDLSAQKYPDKIGFIDEDSSITFEELKNRARSISMEIIKRKIFNKPCAIFMEKGVNCIVSFMGVAYSGNSYTPIDTGMPLERIKKILETLNPEIIITNKENKECLSKINYLNKILIYEDILNNEIDNKLIGKVREKMIDTNPLYILFTSGSTGTPKGVVVCNRSVIDYIEWVTEKFNITEKEIFGNQAPFYFDNSILDIYCTLKNSATMNIIPPKLFSYPIKLLKYLEENDINILFWVPSVLVILANFNLFSQVNLSNIKKILFCGEVMPNKQLNIWRKNVKADIYANLYGPTEITDVCTYYIVNREFADNESLPIGYPCKNTEIILLDENDKLVTECNKIGELCVKGTSLALGYYNNEKKTKEVFVQNPLNKNYPEIIYRTGDLVKYNEKNELIYVCRKDFQIKHMGYRIELGEIEAAVISLEFIEMCCCLYHNEKIVLFYQGNCDKKDILKEIRNKIPKYMLPTSFVKVDKMPLNLNGKIDRKLLNKKINE